MSTSKSFKNFIVTSLNDKSVFIDVNILKRNEFYESLFNYFFDEEMLLKYVENKSKLRFEPTKQNYIILYHMLKKFIDEENEITSINILDIDEEIINIIKSDLSKKCVSRDENRLYIRLDKMGKIGEYIFSCLLSDYFQFNCIIPKLDMLTNRNMPIFGIDVIYYSDKNDLLLFGESKVSHSVDNGIKLINESLKNYSKMINDEIMFVLEQRSIQSISTLKQKYIDSLSVALKVEDFIREAEIKKIGIPIFIAHGGTEDTSLILEKLNKISNIKVFGLETVYYIISLPLIDKDEIMTAFVDLINNKRIEYETFSI